MTDSNQNHTEEEFKADLAQTRELQMRKVQRRKADRRRRALRAAALVMALTLVVAGIGALIRFFVIDRNLRPKEPASVAEPVAEPEPAPVSEPESRAEVVEETVPPVEEEPEVTEETPQEPEKTEEPPAEEDDGEMTEEKAETILSACEIPVRYAGKTDDTQELDLQLYSESAILIDLSTNTILAEKNAEDPIYPASMTKVMTALVACENIENWDDTFTMTQSIIDPLFQADASMAGFVDGEAINMEDLVYGAIVPSGAEATEALSITIAGSEEAYAEKMNEKAAALGLNGTHFVDASGLHDEEHYTTVHDMAVILEAAMENETCREVLEALSHRSAATPQNPEGIPMYNKFLQTMYVTGQNGAKIMGAKTGYTSQAMNCCASFGVTPDGRPVVCVTAHAWTGEFCVEDHIALYSKYCG